MSETTTTAPTGDYTPQGHALIAAKLKILADRNGPDSMSAQELAYFTEHNEAGLDVALSGLFHRGEATGAEVAELSNLSCDPELVTSLPSAVQAGSIHLGPREADAFEDSLARLGGLIREVGEPLRSQLVAEFRVAVALINADAGPLSPHLEPIADLLA